MKIQKEYYRGMIVVFILYIIVWAVAAWAFQLMSQMPIMPAKMYGWSLAIFSIFYAVLGLWMMGTMRRRRDEQMADAADKELVRRLVALHSEGNASLYMGNYITQEDVNQMRKEVLGHDFKKRK